MWEQLDQRELKKNLKINKKDSKDKSTKTRVILPYIKGVSEVQSQVFFYHGVVMSITWNSGTQEDSGTSQGQMDTAGKFRCSVLDPM